MEEISQLSTTLVAPALMLRLTDGKIPSCFRRPSHLPVHRLSQSLAAVHRLGQSLPVKQLYHRLKLGYNFSHRLQELQQMAHRLQYLQPTNAADFRPVLFSNT